MHFGRFIGLAMFGIFFAAFPSSTSYKLQSWGVNSGATNSSSSSTYKLRGSAGEIGGQTPSSTSYKSQGSSIGAAQASTPPAPTVDNGSSTYYNKLHFVISNSANPSDATFAVEISTASNFSSFSYIQADGSSNSSIVWQTYTAWGGASGTYATLLSANTTYYFRVAAQEGKFTASAWGPSANVATVNPSLTFSVSPTTINLGNLNPGSIISDSSMTFTFTTNATNGAYIYVSGTFTGLKSGNGHTINVTPPSQDISPLAEGFGLQGTTSSPLTTQSPYTATGTTVGAIYTSFQPLFTSSGAVSSSPTTTATIKAKAASTTPTGTDYSDVLTFVAAANY